MDFDQFPKTVTKNSKPPQREALKEILAQRGSRYGLFKDHAVIAQRLKNVMRSSPNWAEGKLTDSQKETLEMVAHKIGRILNGDPKYDDSWVDIEGYVHLISEELKGNLI